jgi:hypothetical protein
LAVSLPRPELEQPLTRGRRVLAQGVPALRKLIRQVQRHNLPLKYCPAAQLAPERHGIASGDIVHLGFQKLQVAMEMVQGRADAPVKQFGDPRQQHKGDAENRHNGIDELWAAYRALHPIPGTHLRGPF